jgi:hypothetical protein
MTLQELYQVYGKLMIEQEILNGQINEVKRKIATELNKPAPKTEDLRKQHEITPIALDKKKER